MQIMFCWSRLFNCLVFLPASLRIHHLTKYTQALIAVLYYYDMSALHIGLRALVVMETVLSRYRMESFYWQQLVRSLREETFRVVQEVEWCLLTGSDCCLWKQWGVKLDPDAIRPAQRGTTTRHEATELFNPTDWCHNPAASIVDHLKLHRSSLTCLSPSVTSCFMLPVFPSISDSNESLSLKQLKSVILSWFLELMIN